MLKKEEIHSVLPEERRRQHKGLAVLLGYWLVGIVVAYATPDDILSYRWARGFVDFMGSVVPAMTDVMPTSPIHDVVQFYLAVMWTSMPFFIWGLFFYVKDYKDAVKMFREKKLFGLFAFLVCTPILVYFLYTDADGSTWQQRAAMSSRLGLAGMYAMVLDSVVGFCAMMLLWLRNIPQVYFRKG